MDKKRFYLYTDYKKHLNLLTLEQKGQLMDAIFAHAEGEDVELTGVVEMAFSFIAAQMDRDNENYERTCEKRRESGAKGGLAKAKNIKQKLANASKDKQKLANASKREDIDKDIDIDIDKDIDKKINYQEIADLYNSICKSLPRATCLSDKRKRAIKSRLKSYSIDDLKKAFQMAEDSDFLSGRSGKWTGANFDWLMNETNLVKVLEGNYRNNKTTKIDIDSNFRDFLESNEVVNWD